jgi:hypothetical protein
MNNDRAASIRFDIMVMKRLASGRSLCQDDVLDNAAATRYI